MPKATKTIIKRKNISLYTESKPKHNIKIVNSWFSQMTKKMEEFQATTQPEVHRQNPAAGSNIHSANFANGTERDVLDKRSLLVPSPKS